MRLEDVIKVDSNVYLIDLSFLLHKYHYVYRDMHVDINGYARPTGHIYGVLYDVRTIYKMDKNAVIFICEDGIPVERNELMAQSGEGGYKEGRPELDFNFYADKPLIKALLMLLPNVHWVFDADKEADDAQFAISKLVQDIPGWNGKSFIYSGDNDLLQSIDERTSVVRYYNESRSAFVEINEEVVTTDERFTKKFHGVDPAHLPLFRAICGDTSDKIKGISRFPRDIAVQIAMGTFYPSTSRELKYAQIYNENLEIIDRNLKLMRLKVYNPTITHLTPNMDKCRLILSKLEINSYRKFLKEELGIE